MKLNGLGSLWYGHRIMYIVYMTAHKFWSNDFFVVLCYLLPRIFISHFPVSIFLEMCIALESLECTLMCTICQQREPMLEVQRVRLEVSHPQFHDWMWGQVVILWCRNIALYTLLYDVTYLPYFKPIQMCLVYHTKDVLKKSCLYDFVSHNKC